MIATFRKLLPYLVRYRWRYAAGGLALTAGTAFTAAVPLVIREAIDRFVAGAGFDELRTLAGLILAVVFARGVLRFTSRALIAGAARFVEFDLRSDLVSKMLTCSRKFFTTYRIGDLTSRAVNDLTAIRMLLGAGLTLAVDLGLTFFWAIAAMSAVDWKLTCAVFAPLPLISLTVSHFGRRIHQRFHHVQSSLADMTSFVERNLANARLVRAYSSGAFEARRFGQANEDYLAENIKLVALWRRMYPAMELLGGATYIVVLVYGGSRVLDGVLSIGSFVMFLTFVTMLIWPMIGLGWVVNLAQRGAAAMERVNEVLARRPLIGDGPATDFSIRSVRGDLELRNVTVVYPEADEPALNAVDLDVPVGRTLALVGPIGGGKSTLLSLVPRLIEPLSGEVRVDREPIATIPLGVLRGAVGLVSQEPFVFDLSLRENLVFGARGSLEQWQIDEAADIACLGDVIDSLPDGYETRVGERGVTLSGGQRQRVALARALLREPRFLLLDDALSSVDAQTEERIISRMRRFLRNRTTLMATHRLTAARHADRIVVLEGGTIVEQGTHEELLAAEGLYCDLSRKQLIEEELVHDA